MAMYIENDSVIAGIEQIQFPSFTELVNAHIYQYPKTIDLEVKGKNLVMSDFDEYKLIEFIHGVCRWGGYAGIAARIINGNQIPFIQNRFRDAVNELESDNCDVGEALYSINNIKGLGTPSFASKHLRFLRPDRCPILDSIISDKLNYDFDPNGYKNLIADCCLISQRLFDRRIENPMNRSKGQWFIADVEMAIFSKINNLQGLTTG